MQPIDGYVTTEDGVRLFYRQIGNGPAVILPNGFHLLGDFNRFADRRTLICYDVRNRGLSDRVDDKTKLARGVHNDAGDLETIRRHFGITGLDVIAHSYTGVILALYAMKYPVYVNRLVLIGPMQPDSAAQYPAHLMCADATLAQVLSGLGQLQKERANQPSEDPKEACEKFWSVLRPLYVFDPDCAGKINWGRCDLPNERNFMTYWNENILPSIQALHFSPAELANSANPMLIVHGDRDRSAPYGGGRDWALRFPDARLVTAHNAGHAPWIETPELVFGAIDTFLDGKWPETAEKVRSLDPNG